MTTIDLAKVAMIAAAVSFGACLGATSFAAILYFGTQLINRSKP